MVRTGGSSGGRTRHPNIDLLGVANRLVITDEWASLVVAGDVQGGSVLKARSRANRRTHPISGIRSARFAFAVGDSEEGNEDSAAAEKLKDRARVSS
jgi:hypothetical protein